MKSLHTLCLSACLLAATGAAFAADDMAKKPDAMTKDGMAKPMTMQECKDHVAMAKEGMKKDDAMMKKDATCAAMLKKDDMMKPAMAASEPMPMKK